jgi:hypothetical protein
VDFDLKIRFSAGWCTLGLSSGAERIELHNHWVSNRFRAFTAVACAIFDGAETAGCRWPRELAGGYFVDAVRHARGGLSLAVHEMYFGNEAHTIEQIYSARRGPCVFDAGLTVGEFAVVLATELRRVRLMCADPTGVIHEWRAAFPEPEFQAIERFAAAHGYEPRSAAQLRTAADDG